MAQVLNQASDIPSAHSAIHGSISTTFTTSLRLSVTSTQMSTEVSTTHTESFTTTTIQASTNISFVSSLGPLTTAYGSAISPSASSLFHASGNSYNYTSLTESVSDQRSTTSPFSSLRSTTSSSSPLKTSQDISVTSEFSSSRHVAGRAFSFNSTLSSPTLSTETSPVSSASPVIRPTPTSSTVQSNSVNGIYLNTSLGVNTSDTSLHPVIRSSPISHMREASTSIPSRRDDFEASISIRQDSQLTLSSSGAVIQTSVKHTMDSSFSSTITPVSIVHMSLPSISTQTLFHISESPISELTPSAKIPLNSTLIVSTPQMRSTDMTSVMSSTVTSKRVTMPTQNALNTATSPIISDDTSASLTINLSSSIADSGAMGVISSLRPSVSSESVTISLPNTLNTTPYSFPSSGVTSVPLTGRNQTWFSGALSTTTVEPSPSEIPMSNSLLFNLSSTVQSTQHLFPDETSTDSQMLYTTNSSSVHTLVSNIQDSTSSNKTVLVTEHVLSSSTVVPLTDLSASSITLQPSFSASSSETLKQIPVGTRTMGLDFSASSRILESAYTTESTTESITFSIITLDHSASMPVSTDLILPSLTSSVPVTPSATPVITLMGDLKFIFEFEGDCDRLILNAQLQIEFWQALIAVLAIHSTVPIPTENVQPEDLTCKPFQAVFILKSLDYTDYVKLTGGNLTITQVGIPILDDMSVIEFEVKSFQVIPMPKKNPPIEMGRVLDKEDIIIIVVAGALFVLLTCMCVAIACRECYRKRRAASFNLLDVPRVSLDMDDFTLTKIPRPKLIHKENNATTRATPIYNGNQYPRPKYLPVGDVNSAETLRIRPVSTDSIQVRIQPHPDGVVVGVTCTPPRSPTRDCSNSEHSSPRSEASEPAKQTLLKNGNPQYGMNNPNFEGDDDLQGVKGRKYVINEDEDEALL